MDRPLKILIVDDDKRMTRTLADILELEGYLPSQAFSGEQALELVKVKNFDCVLSDIKMSGIDGVECHRLLKELQPDLPVILMTAYTDEEVIRKGLEAGVVAALEKPLDINQLLGFFAALQKNRTIAIIDDDPNFCITLGDILQARGYNVRKVTDPQTDVADMTDDVQIVLLDMKLNQIKGQDVLQQIRIEHPDLPVLLITGYRQEMEPAIQKAIQIGAHTCLYKPLELSELLDTLAEIRLKNLRDELRKS